MASSALDKELIRYFTRLDDAQKKSLLEMMKSFLKPLKKPAGGATIEEYNRELDEAMARVSRGEFTTLEALEKEMQSW